MKKTKNISKQMEFISFNYTALCAVNPRTVYCKAVDEGDSAFCQLEKAMFAEALVKVNSVFHQLTKCTVTLCEVIVCIN